MYIENAYKGKTEIWKYLLVYISFFGLMGLNFLASQFFDTEQMMRHQIASKGENQFLLENLFPFVIMLGGLLFWVRYVHGLKIKDFTTTRKKIDWSRFFFSFFLWGGISALMVFIDYYLNPQDYVWNFQLEPFLYLFVIVLIFIPLQTSFEEYFFRGYVMQGLGVMTKNRWFPLAFSSITFGLMHIANPEIGKMGYILLLYYIGTGFLLGIMTLMDKGMELALGFHASNNIVTALLVTSGWTAFQTPSILKDVSESTSAIDIFIPLLVLYPILLLIFAKRYKWTNWKTKLTGKVEKLKTEKNDTNIR